MPVEEQCSCLIRLAEDLLWSGCLYSVASRDNLRFKAGNWILIMYGVSPSL